MSLHIISEQVLGVDVIKGTSTRLKHTSSIFIQRHDLGLLKNKVPHMF